MTLPFFAYGIFKPGQLGFCQLKELALEATQSDQLCGTLLIRDGLPIVDENGSGVVNGTLLSFDPSKAQDAYSRISALEPEHQYSWALRAQTTNGIRVNVLYGRSPATGSVTCEEEWDGWKDPLFTTALEVIEETLNSNRIFEWDLKPLFRLQMAYLLLWSAIERYLSLRYYFGDCVSRKVERLADEPAFGLRLQQYVDACREVRRADDPSKKFVLDRLKPLKSVRYYYQVRCNIIHRGKGVVKDHDGVLKSLDELVQIFRGVLQAAREGAEPNI